MSFKRVLGLLCAASVSVVLANAASAQDKTVKIGAIFPLSGGAASAGVHAKAAIETAITDLKGMLEGENAEVIKEKTASLAEAAMKLGEAMYKASQAEAEAKAAGTDKAADDDVVDADFEEVADDDKKSA